MLYQKRTDNCLLLSFIKFYLINYVLVPQSNLNILIQETMTLLSESKLPESTTATNRATEEFLGCG
ncbi:MAG: hypothetical protein D3919_14185 [Candidatus Electrothrix sp. AW5]|nr:hypothetical protein [Candidatus Electrothrix gigas]MCI5193536.1 hypothetical protein [Candidatus Electrothrix gigas]MCI5197340.1 hypothetical protein [Candidatus Electrothrix gigas]MCI5227216.1 hypothetical protein [Candidatus Electrothrix gigas]